MDYLIMHFIKPDILTKYNIYFFNIHYKYIDQIYYHIL